MSRREKEQTPQGREPPDLKRLARQLRDMETLRDKWVPVWKDIADFICPGLGLFDKIEPNQGGRKDAELLDPTPLESLGVLAAGLQGGLTSPSRPWFQLEMEDWDVKDRSPARIWLDDVEERMERVFAHSNIYRCLHTLYLEIGAFGTGCMILEEDAEHVVRGRTLTAGEYCLSCGADGRVNRMGRSFWMTAAQMEEEFGLDALSEGARNAFEAGRLDQSFRVCQLIGPDPKPASAERAYLSVYWEEGKLEKPLRAGHYREFPVLAPRWNVSGGDFYGRGPGWNALGESRMLQEMRLDYLDAQKLSIRPPIVGPNTLREAEYRLYPGGITLVDDMKDPNQYFKALYQVRPDAAGQTASIQDSREIIRGAFFADLFLAIMRNPDRNMTATQVNAIVNEQMMIIGPVYERLNHELLDPMIARTLAIMDRRGCLPPPPEDLEGNVKIKYISTLAQAQRRVGLEDIERLTAYVGQLAQINPEALDKFDADAAIDRYARMMETPAAMVRDEENTAQIRQARQEVEAQARQAAEMQQAAAAANQGAGALRQAADAATSGGLSELADLVGLGGTA